MSLRLPKVLRKFCYCLRSLLRLSHVRFVSWIARDIANAVCDPRTCDSGLRPFVNRTPGHWYLTMEEAKLRYCDALELPGIVSLFLRRTSGVPTYAYAYTRLTGVYILPYVIVYMYIWLWNMNHHQDASNSKTPWCFDTWCLRKILRIPYTRHTTNDTVQSITACSPVLVWVKSHRLGFTPCSYHSRGGPSPCHWWCT